MDHLADDPLKAVTWYAAGMDAREAAWLAGDGNPLPHHPGGPLPGEITWDDQLMVLQLDECAVRSLTLLARDADGHVSWDSRDRPVLHAFGTVFPLEPGALDGQAPSGPEPRAGLAG